MRERISSFETFSSKFSICIPDILTNRFVELDRSLTKGIVILEIYTIGLTVAIAIASDFCSAILLGYNSPKTKVKYERTIVMITIEILLL
ncbi:hypothetical protein SDC9_97959 [bioreactor metagenome]|uniref:Uncharacterized protein n=1 Tax=bioreactor metagenome TaxID=1076179 RepID=A0A645ADC8_9ZZZZ